MKNYSYKGLGPELSGEIYDKQKEKRERMD